MKTCQKYLSVPPYNPNIKSPLLSRSILFFRAHPSKSCGISVQDTSFLFCLCIYLPINASWCLDSQCIAYIKQKKSVKHMICTQPSDIYRNPCTHSGIIRHSHGICPTTQLSWLFLEWINVYTSSWGGKIKVMYIINVYIYSLYHSYHTPLMMMYAACQCYVHNQIIYIFTRSSLSLHPPKDDVYDHQRSKWYGMYITAWHICQLSNLFFSPQLPNVDVYDVFI